MTAQASTPRSTHDAAPTKSPRDAWTVTWTVTAGALIAVSIALGLSAALPSGSSTYGLLRQPGQLTTLGLPVVKAIFDYSAALTIGWLVGAVFLAPPQKSGIFDVGGYRCAQAATKCASVWFVAALALIPLNASNTTGFSLGDIIFTSGIWGALDSLEVAQACLLAAAAALLVAVASRTILHPASGLVVLLVAVIGLLPVALSGHATTSGDHDYASDTMIYHLIGISVWVGGLVAFLGLARQRSPHLHVSARRYSVTALVAFIAVAVSGLGNAWVRLSYVSDLWSTNYGRLIVVKFALLVALGVFGVVQRRKAITAIAIRGDRRPLLRLAAFEIALMAGTIGVAVTLGRTPPPPPRPEAFDEIQALLGYDLNGPPTFWRLILDWRPDLIFGIGAVLAAGLYCWGYLRLRRRGDDWPKGRLIAWILGCLLLIFATSSGFGRYAEAQFSVHMMSHMLLGMAAPILLVLGGPTTLALRALPAAGKDAVPGAREALVGLMHSRILRMLTHPLVILPLFVGSFFVVYFSGLFDWMVDSHAGHLIMNLHFLTVGYLYYWVIIGIDPAPRRLNFLVRLALLVAALPFHAAFGLALMNSKSVLGAQFYEQLELPWIDNLLTEQHLGGAIAWAGTEIPLVIVIISLLAQWSRSDAREARRADRRGNSKTDDELNSYNAMLAQLAAADTKVKPSEQRAVAEQE